MERFKAVDAGIIAQKENDPSFTKDENDRITQAEIPDSNAKMNFVHAQQVGGMFLQLISQPDLSIIENQSIDKPMSVKRYQLQLISFDWYQPIDDQLIVRNYRLS